ncbi:MAG: hypothetical protein J6H21_04265 [Firmicutes bacterium]|nr:hypothetical protein [Bacillota bacterium]
MEYVKTFVLLAIFIILAVGNVINIVRHHKENKEAKKAKKEERKRKGLKFWQRDKTEKEAPPRVIREYDEDPDESE